MTDENGSYNAGTMAGAGGRPAQKEAPPFGRRLASLRRQKGLSQRELAERMQTTQKMVDYYERRAANPALEVIQRAAAALEVSPAELLGDEAQPSRAGKRGGPTGKVRQAFEDVSRLPRRQQEHIIRVVTALVMQYEQSRQ